MGPGFTPPQYIYIYRERERERESITLIDIKKDGGVGCGGIKFLEGNFKCSTSKSMILIRVLS